MAGEKIQVPIKIAATAGYGEFNDALYFDPTAFAAMTEAQKGAAIQARYTVWTGHIDRQNAINRDPAVIAARAIEAAAAQAANVREVLASPAFDATLTQIIAAVRTGAITPTDVRARILNAALEPIPNPTPVPVPVPTPGTGSGIMGMPDADA